MKKIIFVIIVAAITITVLLYFDHKKEHMTAGLGTTTGLSFYNKGSYCSDENAMGSNDPYCSSYGYVLY